MLLNGAEIGEGTKIIGSIIGPGEKVKDDQRVMDSILVDE